jgi:poly(hydroxyalkanoate) depolymerase family esterase
MFACRKGGAFPHIRRHSRQHLPLNMKRTVILVATALSFLAFPILAHAGKWISGTVTNTSGSRNYQLWVPAGYDKSKPAPLVMMLHGCMQNAQGLAAISGMNEIAEKNNFLVVYPEQTAEANPLRCWNWFDPKHQMRDAGEPALLADITRRVLTSYKTDRKRVYVVGLSAGGAMASVMGATYPDLFSAIGVSAGLEFKAATSVEGGLAAMKQGGPDPGEQGLLAFNAMGRSAQARRRMPVIVFQGEADPFVNPANADQVIAQWAKTNDYLANNKVHNNSSANPTLILEGSVPGGYGYTKSIYKDRSGRYVMEKWMIKGLGHAWSGSPTAGPFADPKGPNASAEMWRFFHETARKPKARKPKEKL